MMASVLQIGTRWRAQIRREGKSITKTFRTKAQADAWARNTEAGLDKGKLPDLHTGYTSVADLIAKYAELRADSGRPVGEKSNEHYMLAHLRDYFAKMRVRDLNAQAIVQFAQQRRRAGAGPATVNMEISKIGTVLRHTASFLDFELPDVIGKARPMLTHFHLIGSANKRERRPSADELRAIFDWCEAHPEYTLPLRDIIRITGQAAFRRGEVFRLRWADLDEARRVVLVRDRKDPRKKTGNDQWVPLIGDSLEIILRQPRRDELIFPYSPQTASKYFNWACKDKGIVDLHFHDLRHEAASALFEAGWDIPAVAAVTGHKDWRHLKRYTNLDASDIAEKGRLLPFKKRA